MAGLFRRKKKSEYPFCAVVVAAAGSSTRMEGQDKMFSELDGIPVLVRTLLVLNACERIHELVVVVRADMIPEVSRLCQEYGVSKVSKVVSGGDTRTESVLRGVSECSLQAELIAIHDGARPLVTQSILEKTVLRAATAGAAAPVVPIVDTVKSMEKDVITGTVDRSALAAIQTPQVFEAGLIKAAVEKAIADGEVLTDDCACVERLGMKVAATEGSRENIKITTPFDLLLGTAILESRVREGRSK